MTETRFAAPCRDRSWLAVVVAALLLAALLHLPAASAPFFSDDDSILEVLEGVEPPMMTSRNGLDLYRFFSGDPVECEERMAVGALPWRTDPNQKFAHFRPVSSALMWLDHALFGLDPLGPHVHSLLWSLALVFAVALLYRRTLSLREGALALVLVAASSHDDLAVTWWAAREALLAAVAGTFGLVAHIRWRQDRWAPGLPLSLLCFALALGSAEMALQFLAFAGAFALWGDRGPIGARLRSIAPAILLALAYLGVRSALGYGVAGSYSKIDPVADPVAYLRNLWATGPPAAGQLLAQRFDFAVLLPDLVTRRFDWALAGVTSVLFVGALVPAARGSRPADRHTLRWMLAGVLLSLPLCLAGRDEVRAHTFIAPHIGIAAAVAVIARRAWDVVRARGAGTPNRLVGAWLVFAAVVLMALHLVLPVAAVGVGLARASRPPVGEIVRRTALVPGVDAVVVVRTSRFVSRGHFALYHPGAAPSAVWVLSYAALPGSSCTVRRTEADTLLLSTDHGSVVPRSDFFRSDHAPLPEGPIDLGRLRVDVIEVDGLDVRRVAFRFDRPLDDPSLAFVVEREGALVPFELPAVGDEVVLTTP